MDAKLSRETQLFFSFDFFCCLLLFGTLLFSSTHIPLLYFLVVIQYADGMEEFAYIAQQRYPTFLGTLLFPHGFPRPGASRGLGIGMNHHSTSILAAN